MDLTKVELDLTRIQPQAHTVACTLFNHEQPEGMVNHTNMGVSNSRPKYVQILNFCSVWKYVFVCLFGYFVFTEWY